MRTAHAEHSSTHHEFCPCTFVCVQTTQAEADESWFVTLNVLSETRILLTAPYLDSPRLIPLGPKQVINCIDLRLALRQSFAGVVSSPCMAMVY
jgi:hypothetical protein